MEADWSVELTAGDPVILVPWAAASEDPRKCEFVDLRPGGNKIDEIEEARRAPELKAALLLLNSARSPVIWRASNNAVRIVVSLAPSVRQSSIDRVACPTFSPRSHRK